METSAEGLGFGLGERGGGDLWIIKSMTPLNGSGTCVKFTLLSFFVCFLRGFLCHRVFVEEKL